jgi:hypothetical protein
MPAVTIILNPDLADRLRAQAEARHLSIQQWALAILANASERPDHPETWTELNSRRLALIRQHYGTGLSEVEEQELQALQDATAKRFEPADRRRWEHVQHLAQEASGSTDD